MQIEWFWKFCQRPSAISISVLFSVSEYVSGENNKNMVLVSLLFGHFSLIAESCSSCRYCSHQNAYL